MMKKYTFLLLVFFSVTIIASEPIKIAVITDLHYLSPQLSDGKDAQKAYETSTGKNIADLHEVLDTVLARLTFKNMDILLISGDLTCHGERQSHLDLIEKLKHIQHSGTKIFVVPGNHDINIPDAKAYTGNKPTSVKCISEKEFIKWYMPFGYGNALKRDSSSLSYLAEINEDTWLLCFDTNQYREYTTTSITGGRILPQTMTWALDILREAKTKNISVLGMMHHGLVEHMPYQSAFFANYLVDDWKKNAGILADAGLKVVFTGHFHSNDVSLFTSSAGNTIYDVETASLAQYPFAYRVIKLNKGKLFIDTGFITSVAGNPDLATQSRKRLESITRRVARSRIKSSGISFPSDTENALVELIVKMNLMHVRGDEVVDEEMRTAINSFAELLGSEESNTDFQLDFPPVDNRLVIDLRDKISDPN